MLLNHLNMKLATRRKNLVCAVFTLTSTLTEPKQCGDNSIQIMNIELSWFTLCLVPRIGLRQMSPYTIL